MCISFHWEGFFSSCLRSADAGIDIDTAAGLDSAGPPPNGDDLALITRSVH